MQQNTSLTIGSIIRGNKFSYTVQSVLGQGSFGITYLSTIKTRLQGELGNIETEVKVAIKEFFMQEFCSRHDDGSVTEMGEGTLVGNYARKFRKEAENLAKLSHPGIVKVLEVFEANNTCYYSMEYIEGTNLDAYIRKRGSLSEKEATAYIRQIADALSYMHDNKMLHLDLKPLNVMRNADGSKITLIDFGLSKQYNNEGNPESSTTIGLGTPGYAPLEQSNADCEKDFYPTLDLYALGATFFKLLTGETPPKASDVLNEGLPTEKLQQKGVSETVIKAIEQSMEPSKSNRVKNIAEFLCLIDSAEWDNSDEETEVLKPTSASVGEPADSSSSCISLKWLLFALTGVIIVVLIILFAYKGKSLNSNELQEFASQITGTNNGHEYVDLGLSVKWATCNVGAATPESHGDYFAWGETSPKDSYDWGNYKYYSRTTFSHGMPIIVCSKYITDNRANRNENDNLTELEEVDDAACVNWGGSWRMPTKMEIQELYDRCTWTRTSQNGNLGYKVTSNINGNFIFLPASGCRRGSEICLDNETCYYWSCSYLGSVKADFIQRGDYHILGEGERALGYTVRPVCDAEEIVPTDSHEIVQPSRPKLSNSSVTELKSISLSKTSLTLEEGGTAILNVNFSPSNFTDNSISWKSTDTGVAKVSSNGKVTAVKSGSAAIIATCQGKEAYCNVTVNAKEVQPATTGTNNDHEWVDLGLSVKWATCNVGASSPEEYGDYFAWSETLPKNEYNWTNMKYRKEGNDYMSVKYSKYVTDSFWGHIDNKIILDLSDDAARVNWGSNWRMPTKNELEELISNCTWLWTTQRGEKGIKGTSKVNGNSIFLPAAGECDDTDPDRPRYPGSIGCYWSSSLTVGYPYSAENLYFTSSGVLSTGCIFSRCSGRSVRPVCK